VDWAGVRSGAVVLALSCGAMALWPLGADAADPADTHAQHAPAATPKKKASAATKAAPTPDTAENAEAPALAIDLKKALREQMLGKKRLTLVVSDKAETASKSVKASGTASKPESSKNSHAAPIAADHTSPAATAHDTPAHNASPAHGAPASAHPVAVAAPAKATHTVVINPKASRDYIRAKAAAMAGHDAPAHAGDAHGSGHWSYSGATGPEAWGKLQAEFGVCATGQRQSPINIEDSNTLQGPAEPLLFNYTPSNGTVINNGHTVQVDVQGSNTLTVRGSNYALVQIHFHSPSEEQINFRNYAMVAHLVHKNAEGQLAVVAVLLEPGQANAFIDTVWTYMPLDVNDRVRMPAGLFELKGLLPQDQRYYQFLGSLTTPPCTEGVLWMVLKQPVQISAAQLRLFQQLYPNNARPVQPVNNRPVRSAQ